MTDFLAVGLNPLFTIPAEPYPGMEFAIPAPNPGLTEFTAAVQPHWAFDGGSAAWFGGTWRFVTWSSTDVEIEMTGGETCLEQDGYTDDSSCVPDSGSIHFHADEPETALVLTDPGYTGQALPGYVDPVTGEPLCADVAGAPAPGTGTGE
jgi:hypothetical protein